MSQIDQIQQLRVARLIAAAEKAGGDAELGRLLGHQSGSQVGHMRYGRRPITEKTVQKIEALRGYEGWFSLADDLNGEEPNTAVSQVATNIEPAPELRPFRLVPVVGTVQGGDRGYLLELEHAPGHGDGSISYPARDHQSYAVRVRGDSMRPRIKAGEFIVVEPNHECQPGDDVVVVLKDGQRMVKELLYIRDGEATFGSINNGHPNITVAVADIEKMHYVAAIIPRGAFYKA